MQTSWSSSFEARGKGFECARTKEMLYPRAFSKESGRR